VIVINALVVIIVLAEQLLFIVARMVCFALLALSMPPFVRLDLFVLRTRRIHSIAPRTTTVHKELLSLSAVTVEPIALREQNTQSCVMLASRR
jgi:hypothetical protein